MPDIFNFAGGFLGGISFEIMGSLNEQFCA